ncbi:MAG: tail fiber protein [Flavobacteriaceae bacterium]
MKNLLLILVISFTASCTSQRSTFKNISEKDGNIGIGTTSPDELLTVKGKIHTQEVLVDLEGAVAPDYVFEHFFEGKSTLNPNYASLSLTEIETYVKQHHHLPGVPSAKEFEEKGMALKEMNLLLLEKIEELTLFTIQQQKEIDTLKEQLKNSQ